MKWNPHSRQLSARGGGASLSLLPKFQNYGGSLTGSQVLEGVDRKKGAAFLTGFTNFTKQIN